MLAHGSRTSERNGTPAFQKVVKSSDLTPFSFNSEPQA
jgi:hypothetical protein